MRWIVHGVIDLYGFLFIRGCCLVGLVRYFSFFVSFNEVGWDFSSFRFCLFRERPLDPQAFEARLTVIVFPSGER